MDVRILGVETGDFTGWDGYTGCHPFPDPGRGSPCSLTGGCCPTLGLQENGNTGSYPTTDRHNIVGVGFDDIAGDGSVLIPTVPPNGGNFSIKLGNNAGEQEAEMISTTFTVDSIAPNFQYEFTFIMDEPGHNISHQPFFEAVAFDANGIEIPCSRLVFVSGIGPDWNIINPGPGQTVYRDWELFFIDLRGYEGTDVTVQFSTHDCARGAHSGYAYLETRCEPLPLQSIEIGQECAGIDSLMIGAPPLPNSNYALLWDNGSTADSIKVAAKDSVYILEIIPPLGCAVTVEREVNLLGEGNPPAVTAISVTTPGTTEITESCGAAIFRFEKEADATNDTITISVLGSAINGTDYGIPDGGGGFDPVPDTVFIAPGDTLAEIHIEAIPDALTEGWEDIIIQFTRIAVCGPVTVQDTIDIRDVVPANVNLQVPVLPPCSADPTVTIDLSADVTGPHEITWDFDDGPASVYGPTVVSTGTYNQSHTYTAYGTYQIVFTYRDTICDVTYRDTVDFVHTPGPILSINAPTVPNIQGCAPFTASPTVTVSDPAIDNFYWNFFLSDNNGEEFHNNTNPSKPIIDGPGTYTAWFYVETSDPTYCLNKDSTSFQIVVDAPPVTSVNFVPPVLPPCSPSVSVDVPIDVTVSGDIDVEWDFGDGPGSVYTQSVTGANNQVLTQTHTYNSFGVYNITVTTTDRYCGGVTVENEIFNHQNGNPPVIDQPEIGDISVCADQAPYTVSPVVYTDSLDTAINIVYWSLDNGITFQDTTVLTPAIDSVTPNLTFQTTGIHNVIFYVEVDTVANPQYCVNIASVPFQIDIQQIPVFTPDINYTQPPLCPPPGQVPDYNVNIDLSASPDAPDSIVWNFDGVISTTINPNLSAVHDFIQPGTYPIEFTAYDPRGCSDSTFRIQSCLIFQMHLLYP